MTDFYLQNPPMQPKAEIADYVESNGILVPRRFETEKQARNSGLEIICRSEHPQDYAGFSGLLNSPRLDNFGEMNKSSKKQLENYCILTGTSKEEFLSQLSYSFWERLEGDNCKVIADSSLKNRYHMFIRSAYFLVEDSRIISKFDTEGVEDPEVAKIINFYEQIRTLDRFDPNHCPVIEFQQVDRDLLFLQYHRIRDFEESTFSLNREANSDEIECEFVRGVTSKDGVEVKCQVATYNNKLDIFTGEIENIRLLNKRSEAFFAVGANPFPELVNEIQSRERIANFLTQMKYRCGENIDLGFYMPIRGHDSISAIFKPQLGIAVPYDQLFTRDDVNTLYKKAKQTKEDQFVDVHVVSDGRKAFVKRLG